MTKVETALSGVTRLGLDTAPIIYLIERHPVFGDTARAVFDRIAAGPLEAYTSVITLTCSLAISAVAILHVSGDNCRVGVVSLGSEGVY